MSEALTVIFSLFVIGVWFLWMAVLPTIGMLYLMGVL